MHVRMYTHMYVAASVLAAKWEYAKTWMHATKLCLCGYTRNHAQPSPSWQPAELAAKMAQVWQPSRCQQNWQPRWF